MNRRDFIVRSSCFTAAGLLLRSSASAQTPATPAPRPAQAPAPVTTEFRPLRRDVGIFSGRGGTIGWLSNRDALLAIDTQFPDTAKLFLAGLPGRGERQIDIVINTHHHGDHVGGNGVLKPATKSIVAHANVPALQRARATQDKTLDNQTYADATFAESWKKELGGEVVQARYHGVGHTKGDIITHLEKANVVHMGDLMFNRVYPVIDRPGGGNIRHWAMVLEEAARTYPADAIYVFGHGNPKFGVTGTRGDLLLFRDYLSSLLDYVQTKITAGEPKEKIVALDNLAGFTDFHVPVGPANRLPGNLSVAFDELMEKKG